jgi:hypothetical protein
MAVDVAALSLRIESVGFNEAASLLGALEKQGVKADVTFKGLGATTTTTGTATKKLEGVFRAVGLQMAGFSGQSAQLGKTLLSTWGPGGLATAAIVIGIGLVGKAYQDAKKDAAEFQKQVLAAEASALTGRPGKLSPLVQAGIISSQIDEVRGRRGGLVGQTFDRLERGETVATSLQQTLAKDLLEINRLSSVEMALRKQADDEHQAAVTEAAVTRIRAEQEALELIRQQNIELGKGGVWRAPALLGLPGGSFTAAAGLMDSLAVRRAGLTGGIPTDTGADLARQAAALYEQHVKGLRAEAIAQQQVAMTIGAISNAVAGLIATLQGGGGFWSVISSLLTGVGGALAFTNPVAGALLIGGGTIIGAASAPSTTTTSTAATPAAQPPVIFNATIIGENDPAAQRAIAALVSNAAARGYGVG